MQKSQSELLSERHSKRNDNGQHLNDDSKHSEKSLTRAISLIVSYIKQHTNLPVTIKKTMTLYDLQCHFKGPIPDVKNKNISIRPDGGIIFVGDVPLLITEDKVQGSNDTRHEKSLDKQATGNAIERGFKNVRAAEMLFCNRRVFPYVIFAAGCDFHHTETIASRIVTGNYGVPNHYISLTPETTSSDIQHAIQTDIIPSINIKKRYGDKSIVSCFIKSHKYDEMKHGSSLWETVEIYNILKEVVKQSLVGLDTSSQ